MMNIIDKHTSLAIIGNGFDLQHGYKTKYTDFTEAIGESFFSEYKEYIGEYTGCIEEWNVFEKQVEKLTGAFYQKAMSFEGLHIEHIRKFNSLFSNIQYKLAEYLKVETTRKKFNPINSIKESIGSKTLVLNFNYTNIAEKYTPNIIYVHGSIDEGEIVLGYDPIDSFCLATYEDRKWFKQFGRARLAYKRYITNSLGIPVRSQLYHDLYKDFEQALNTGQPGRGFEDSDILTLKYPEYFKKEFVTYDEKRYWETQGISFENIDTIYIMGHSIKSDEIYLKIILDLCPCLQQVVIFSYENEEQKNWDDKASFFKQYCDCIEKKYIDNGWFLAS